ncbi:ADP-ribose pyrophosphatase YjhB (NUDIX family) [Umezawaea tangerina]|uniref:ADP-ribose pyrophosphatase YjhB (NUDIX family) n=1 Tax=Umezawaea tangerina TaxID=84725 RepID=A0A2T0SLJ6_9PSEU|nr:ADP-ribose pyrophosphatase YjhB (NUDIX family) [Umezawaea tangerina]
MTNSDGRSVTTRVFTADVVLFTRRGGELLVLAVERGKEPFSAALALPGGFVEPGESALDAAVRELEEETGMEVERKRLRRFGYYSEPGRDPRGCVISVAFHGYAAGVPEVAGGSDARTASWLPVADFLSGAVEVAFDHRDIVRDAVVRKFGWCPVSAEGAAASPGAAGARARGGRGRPDARSDGSSGRRSRPGSPRSR